MKRALLLSLLVTLPALAQEVEPPVLRLPMRICSPENACVMVSFGALMETIQRSNGNWDRAVKAEDELRRLKAGGCAKLDVTEPSKNVIPKPVIPPITPERDS